MEKSTTPDAKAFISLGDNLHTQQFQNASQKQLPSPEPVGPYEEEEVAPRIAPRNVCQEEENVSTCSKKDINIVTDSTFEEKACTQQLPFKITRDIYMMHNPKDNSGVKQTLEVLYATLKEFFATNAGQETRKAIEEEIRKAVDEKIKIRNAVESFPMPAEGHGGVEMYVLPGSDAVKKTDQGFRVTIEFSSTVEPIDENQVVYNPAWKTLQSSDVRNKKNKLNPECSHFYAALQRHLQTELNDQNLLVVVNVNRETIFCNCVQQILKEKGKGYENAYSEEEAKAVAFELNERSDHEDKIQLYLEVLADWLPIAKALCDAAQDSENKPEDVTYNCSLLHAVKSMVLAGREVVEMGKMATIFAKDPLEPGARSPFELGFGWTSKQHEEMMILNNGGGYQADNSSTKLVLNGLLEKLQAMWKGRTFTRLKGTKTCENVSAMNEKGKGKLHSKVLVHEGEGHIFAKSINRKQEKEYFENHEDDRRLLERTIKLKLTVPSFAGEWCQALEKLAQLQKFKVECCFFQRLKKNDVLALFAFPENQVQKAMKWFKEQTATQWSSNQINGRYVLLYSRPKQPLFPNACYRLSKVAESESQSEEEMETEKERLKQIQMKKIEMKHRQRDFINARIFNDRKHGQDNAADPTSEQPEVANRRKKNKNGKPKRGKSKWSRRQTRKWKRKRSQSQKKQWKQSGLETTEKSPSQEVPKLLTNATGSAIAAIHNSQTSPSTDHSSQTASVPKSSPTSSIPSGNPSNLLAMHQAAVNSLLKQPHQVNVFNMNYGPVACPMQQVQGGQMQNPMVYGALQMQGGQMPANFAMGGVQSQVQQPLMASALQMQGGQIPANFAMGGVQSQEQHPLMSSALQTQGGQMPAHLAMGGVQSQVQYPMTANFSALQMQEGQMPANFAMGGVQSQVQHPMMPSSSNGVTPVQQMPFQVQPNSMINGMVLPNMGTLPFNSNNMPGLSVPYVPPYVPTQPITFPANF